MIRLCRENMEVICMSKQPFIADHPLIQHKVSMLRDVSTPSNQFRGLIKEISLLNLRVKHQIHIVWHQERFTFLLLFALRLYVFAFRLLFAPFICRQQGQQFIGIGVIAGEIQLAL